nr:glycosyltransferase [Clostridium paraputrificum]
MKTFISIIVPIYKIREEYLKKCIESLINQTYKNIKIILVIDGSPDNSLIICNEYAEKDSRIIVINQENQGVSVARNAGIDIADSEWVTFVDPDDWIETNMAEELNNLTNNIKCDIVMYDYCREYENRSKYEFMKESNGFCKGQLLKDIRLAPFNRFIIDNKVQSYTINAIWNKCYRLSFINKYNLRFIKDARKGQDRLFNMIALDSTEEIYYLHKMFYHYRSNSGSITNRYNPMTIMNSEVAFMVYDKWLAENNKEKEYKDALNTRICTRLYEYMKLYYFHEESTYSYKDGKKNIKELLKKEPYKTAFDSVKLNLLTLEEKIFVLLLKSNQIFICNVLIKLRVCARNVTIGKSME